jgi:hypothetical protein
MGTWDTSLAVMNIPYHDTAKIFGFQIKSTVRKSVFTGWTKTTAIIRTQAQENYCRTMTLDMRIKYAHEYLMAHARYVSQIYPLPDVCVRQLNTTISWFVWKGDIFRVPLSTLYQPKEDGGWDVTNFSAKSHALLPYRMRQNMMKQGTITWAWFRTWGLSAKGTNPPFRDIIPDSLEYLRCCAMRSAYVKEQGTMETKRAYQRRLYNILYNMNRHATGIQEMSITKLWPTTDWTITWKNIHCTPISGAAKAVWYKASNDILPPNDRLYRIKYLLLTSVIIVTCTTRYYTA